jgi:hypothetical protein
MQAKALESHALPLCYGFSIPAPFHDHQNVK